MPADRLLECRELTVRFGGVTALDAVDFSAADKRITGVIGPNGAGKTTLLNAVTGMVTPAGGSISLQGKDITSQQAFRRARLGVVRTFQNLEVFTNMSVLENVMTGRHRRVRYGMLDGVLKTSRFRREERACRDYAMQCLEFVDLADKADHPAADLPFGGQRMMELARALAAEPTLLLLDEPAAGLNMRETKRLGDIIVRIKDELGVAVTMVEHDMDLIMSISHEIFVLHFGKKLAVGTPEAVRENPDVIHAYLGEDDDEPQAAQG